MLSTGKMNDTVAAFPKLSAYLLIIIGALLVINFASAMKRNKLKQKKIEKIEYSSYIRVSIIIAMFVIYMYIIEVLGFIIPTFILMAGIIRLVGYTNIKINIITSLCITLGLFLIFKYFFQVHFPKEIFF
jgi:membrane-associated HD superfamily phosphohydrolase